VTPTRFGRWEVLGGDPIGEGGQGRTWKVRDMDGENERHNAAAIVWFGALGSRNFGEIPPERRTEKVDQLAEALRYLASSRPTFGALKKLIAPDGESRKRLRDEAETYRRVDHPNLLRILDANLNEDWIVTEFQPLGNLNLSARPYYGDPIGAIDQLLPMVEALSALHRQSFVHRDIKPANIFLSDHGFILGDAGLVFGHEGDRPTGTLENVGTIEWQAPWTIGQRQVNVHGRDDLYPIGKLLWALTGGRVHGKTHPVRFHRRDGFNLTHSLPGVPGVSAINDVLDRIICGEAEEMTISSADDFATELRGLRSHLAIAATSLKGRPIVQEHGGHGYALQNSEIGFDPPDKFRWTALVTPKPNIQRALRLDFLFMGVDGQAIERRSYNSANVFGGQPHRVDGVIVLPSEQAERVRIVEVSIV
jgi:serine/threonine protein kinase